MDDKMNEKLCKSVEKYKSELKKQGLRNPIKWK